MPWHPTLVHYPMALTVLAAAFQLIAVLGRKENFFCRPWYACGPPG